MSAWHNSLWGSNLHHCSFWGPGVSLCMSSSPQPGRLAGCTCIYSSACDHKKKKTKTKNRQTPAAPNVPSITMIFLFVFMELVYQMPSTIMCTYQELPRRQRWWRRPGATGCVLFLFFPGINPEWPQRGLTWVPYSYPFPEGVCAQRFKLTPGSVCPDALDCFHWRVAQQMLSGEKTDSASMRGTCCSN